MSMTRRALARSATTSVGAAIAVLRKTRLALSGTAALQHTRLGADAYGRFCPVHVWPVLRCPPRSMDHQGLAFPIEAHLALGYRDRAMAHQGSDVEPIAYAARYWRANFVMVGIAHSIVGGTAWSQDCFSGV